MDTRWAHTSAVADCAPIIIAAETSQPTKGPTAAMNRSAERVSCKLRQEKGGEEENMRKGRHKDKGITNGGRTAHPRLLRDAFWPSMCKNPNTPERAETWTTHDPSIVLLTRRGSTKGRGGVDTPKRTTVGSIIETGTPTGREIDSERHGYAARRLKSVQQ